MYAEVQPMAGERLFRRCKPSHIDPKTGQLGYWLFSNSGSDQMMSADLERCRSLEDELMYVEASGDGLVALDAVGVAREGQLIAFWPEPDNTAHCQVIGDKKDRTKKRLLDLASLVKSPRDG